MKIRNMIVYLAMVIMITSISPVASAAGTPAINEFPMKVCVNDQEIYGIYVYSDSVGDVWVYYSALKNIFPTETQNIYLPAYEGKTLLTEWTSSFGYNMSVKRNIVYLDNRMSVSPIPAPPATSISTHPVQVYVNGSLIMFPDQQPVIVNNRTMVPIRALVENLNWQVEYENYRVTISNSENTIHLWIGSTTYLANKEVGVMDVYPIILQNRTLVPLRFVSEALGFTVDYANKDGIGIVTLTKQ